MVAVGVLMAWAGYSIGTWGWILIKGWDIPLGSWVSPVNPYTWPKPPADPPLIPSSQLLPSAASSQAGSQGGLVTAGPVSNPRPKGGQVGRTTKPGGPKTGP